MQQIQGSTIQSLFANRDIPHGCRSTTTTTPSTHLIFETKKCLKRLKNQVRSGFGMKFVVM